MPLLAQAGAVASFAAVYGGPLSDSLPDGLPGLVVGGLALVVGGYVLGGFGSIFARLVYRVAALRRLDYAAGVPLGGLVATATIYLGLVGTLTLDAWLQPLFARGAVIGPQEVAALQKVVAENPAAAAFVSPEALQAMAKAAAEAPITREQLARVNVALGFYLNDVRPRLLESRIAPALVALGEDLPVIGQKVKFPEK